MDETNQTVYESELMCVKPGRSAKTTELSTTRYFVSAETPELYNT